MSLVGLLTCGVLGPIGLLLSIFALFKQPRGLAIAGFVLGLIGTGWAVVMFAFVGFGAMATAVGIGDLGESETEMRQIARAFNEAMDRGETPTSVSDLDLADEVLTDPWGNPYEFGTHEWSGLTIIRTWGPDGIADTYDDREFDPADLNRWD